MSGISVAILGFVGMLVLIAVRMPVGLSMLVTGAAGYVYLSGWGPFLAYMKTNPYYQFANYTLSVIPLFVLMGAFAERSGLATALFRAGSAFVGHLRGGLAMAVIAACTGFGAICGSSVATTATFGRAALPEFARFRYDPGLATGTIAVGGTLGILIPPSVILVVYAISTEQNIAKLFMAAFVPGILAALFYCAVIAVVTRRDPKLAPQHEKASGAERMRSLMAVWPALLIALIVVGGIYGGVFTPTEGAAVGAVAMLVLGIAQRTLGWREIRQSLLQTAETSGMIFIILLGSEVFNAFLALSQLPTEAADWVSGLGLPPYAVVAVLLAFYIVLGAVMDELAMILLTLPVFFPIVTALEFGLPTDEVAIWFGILVLIVVGIGLTAPPIGLNVFVISAIAKEVPITRTYKGVLPFLVADVVRLALVVAFPSLALALVRWLT
ncbi:TRAP transporter large permease [Chelatococcus sp. SYSU_G07232]|uniref:TRAP transporter large permease protein n=1 Tax=Chelatococcus albus TaxID=3047466 RepID=A0ABT7AGN3_9HYPH|nr:TRAP transporter large permease [Chelatococcus sp. SYSU_G07232]MDJ1158518.1 TRAP transporter large permease [Chelatococcus sp. SYSU_G07232]